MQQKSVYFFILFILFVSYTVVGRSLTSPVSITPATNVVCTNEASFNIVSTIAEFDAAVTSAEPGDKLGLATGVLRNTELVFVGQ